MFDVVLNDEINEIRYCLNDGSRVLFGIEVVEVLVKVVSKRRILVEYCVSESGNFASANYRKSSQSGVGISAIFRVE